MSLVGPDGVGKTTLLREWQDEPEAERWTVGYAEGRQATAGARILAAWTQTLKLNGLSFSKYERVRDAQRRARKALTLQVGRALEHHAYEPELLNRLVEFLLSQLSQPGTDVILQMLQDAFQLFGPLMAGDIADSLRRHSQILANHTNKLTEAFLADLARARGEQPIALIVDDVDCIPELHKWLVDILLGSRVFAPHPLLLLVSEQTDRFATRSEVWLRQANHDPATEQQRVIRVACDGLSDGESQALVQRYCAYRNVVISTRIAQQIARHSEGFPLRIISWIELVRLGGSASAPASCPSGRIVAEVASSALKVAPRGTFTALSVASVARTADSRLVHRLLEQPSLRNYRAALGESALNVGLPQSPVIHHSVREAFRVALRRQAPERYGLLHTEGFEYYADRLATARGTTADMLPLRIESTYHAICLDEVRGLERFRDLAEELAGSNQCDELAALLNAAVAFPIRRVIHRRWVDYYRARLHQLENDQLAAEREYLALLKYGAEDARLRTFLWCDLAPIRCKNERLGDSRGHPNAEQEALEVLTELQRVPEFRTHPKVTSAMGLLSWLLARQGDWTGAIKLVREQASKTRGDPAARVFALNRLRELYAMRGDFRQSIDAFAEAKRQLEEQRTPGAPFIRALLQLWPWSFVWSGRLAEALNQLRDSERTFKLLDHREFVASVGKDTALVHSLKGRHKLARDSIAAARDGYLGLGLWQESELASTQGVEGFVLMRSGSGHIAQARQSLENSLRLKEKLKETIGVPEVAVWLAELTEREGDTNRAAELYGAVIANGGFGRLYFECAALAGYARTASSGGSLALRRATTIATSKGYSDLLARLHLTRGRFSLQRKQAAAAERQFRAALINGVEFNHYLLAEVVSGEGSPAPAESIVTSCRAHGAMSTLRNVRDWWATACVPGSEQKLVDAEAAVYAREQPGRFNRRRTVLNELDRALQRG